MQSFTDGTSRFFAALALNYEVEASMYHSFTPRSVSLSQGCPPLDALNCLHPKSAAKRVTRPAGGSCIPVMGPREGAGIHRQSRRRGGEAARRRGPETSIQARGEDARRQLTARHQLTARLAFLNS